MTYAGKRANLMPFQSRPRRLPGHGHLSVWLERGCTVIRAASAAEPIFLVHHSH